MPERPVLGAGRRRPVVIAHGSLLGRDEPDQHPVEAIGGLDAWLVGKLIAGSNITLQVDDDGVITISASGGGGGGAVDSVNAQTGTVVLDAGDVGAVPVSSAVAQWHVGWSLIGTTVEAMVAGFGWGVVTWTGLVADDDGVKAVDHVAQTITPQVPDAAAGDVAVADAVFDAGTGSEVGPSIIQFSGTVWSVIDFDLAATNSDLATLTSHTGSGLFSHVNGSDLWDAAEGTLDRWKMVSAFSTVNVDLTSLVGVPVPTQPTLDGGVAPPASTNSAVWLFGQTTAAENGCYIVSAGSDGHWTHQVNPATFDPPGNSYEVHVSAPGTAIDGVWFEWLDDDPAKWMRVSQQPGFTPDEAFVASTSGRWFRHPRPTRTLGTDPAIPVTAVDAKGDLLVGTASDSVSRLGVGTNGQVLTADSGEASGMKWAAASGVHTYTGALPSVTVAYSNLGTFANTTAHPLTAVNRRCWVPIYLPAGTFTRIAIFPWTSGNASTWRLGLHADSGGWPGALLADFGTVSTSSASLQAVTISQTVTAGWYWAQIQVDAYTATPNVMCVSGLTAHPVMPLGFPTDIASGSRGLAAMYDALGTGGALAAAPASLTAASLFASAPRVWVYIP